MATPSQSDPAQIAPLSPAASGFVPVQAWARLPWLRAGFSTRAPGASLVYQAGNNGAGEQNLGLTREDDPELVALNRRRFVQAVCGRSKFSLATIRQVHSGTVIECSGAERDALRPADIRDEHGPAQEADGMITARSGQLLGILTADCVPVLVADTRTHVVAAFHAGWRGTLARIVENGVGLLRTRHGARAEDLVAAIGPSIRPCCFEVGDDVRSAFAEAVLYAGELFLPSTSASKLRMDLQEANRRQLVEAGLAPEQIQTVPECTACCRTAEGQRKYFSYRAESGVTGRMLSMIGVVNP